MFAAPGWTQSGANYLKPMRMEIIGTTHHQMEFIMLGTAEQDKSAAEPTQAAIALGRPETPAGVSQIQKGEIHQVDLRRDPTFEPEHLAMGV
jgi:hypothetical protein